jgi:hypothetical protein
MPCDTRVKRGQSLQQRATEVRDVVAKVGAKLASGQVRVKVGPTGAVALEGITDQERDDVTDACIYRRIMASGTALAKMAFQRAEQLAGRTVNRQSLAHGHHSHDGGVTWHDHK